MAAVKQTYFKTVMLGLDDFGASIILNRNDMCISAACGLVLCGKDQPLVLHAWQRALLRTVGRCLDFFFPGHCEGAILGDLARARSSIAILFPQA